MTDLPPPPGSLPPPPRPPGVPEGPPQAPPYPSPPPTSRTDLPPFGPGAPASIGQRAVARLLDLFLVSLPMQGWALLAGFVTTEGGEATVDAPDWFLVLTLVLPVVYELVMIGSRGQTLGKMALRIRVARYVDGVRPTWQQSAFRALLPAAPQFVTLILPPSADTFGYLLTMVSIYMYLAAAFDLLNRGIHDKAAGTLVLRTR